VLSDEMIILDGLAGPAFLRRLCSISDATSSTFISTSYTSMNSPIAPLTILISVPFRYAMAL